MNHALSDALEQIRNYKAAKEIFTLDVASILEIVLEDIFQKGGKREKAVMSRILEEIPNYDFKSYVMNECLFNIYIAVKYKKYETHNADTLVSCVKILMIMYLTFYNNNINGFSFYKQIDDNLLQITGDSIQDRIAQLSQTDQDTIKRNFDGKTNSLSDKYRILRYVSDIKEPIIQNIIYGLFFPKTIANTKKSLMLFNLSTMILVIKCINTAIYEPHYDIVKSTNGENYYPYLATIENLNNVLTNDPNDPNISNESVMNSLKYSNEMISRLVLSFYIDSVSKDREEFMKLIQNILNQKKSTFSKIKNFVTRKKQ